MRNAVICGYTRSPFTLANKGELAKLRPDDLLSQVITNLCNLQIKTDEIEDLIVGCAFPEGEQGLNVARIVGLLSGLHNTVAATTVNRFCGSSMQAIHMAAGAIATNSGDVFICGGVESMSRIPMMGFNPMPNVTLGQLRPEMYYSMGQTADIVAERYQISRIEQEKFAVDSHIKASIAKNNQKLVNEITKISFNGEFINEDGCIRTDSTLEKLAALSPAFAKDGTVTAGTSSPLTDGAAAVLVTSEDYAKANNLNILARIKSMAVVGCKPEIMGMGPVDATNRALVRAGLTIDKIDIIELNEAFAAQSLACIIELGLNPSKVNIDGGAIALGHPLGATGARIVGKAASLLVRENKQFALATQCIGGGQGIATILERV